jgi:hypothetical protein
VLRGPVGEKLRLECLNFAVLFFGNFTLELLAVILLAYG